MRHLLTVTTAILALGGASAAQAEGLYGKVGVGFSVVEDHEFVTSSGEVETDLNEGYGLNAAIGKDFGMMRGELTITKLKVIKLRELRRQVLKVKPEPTQ